MDSVGTFSPISIIVFALLFSLVASVHELGHFLVAKRAGVKVEEFAFGLPPRLYSFQRGETAYSINLIPVLAYVRLQGEEDPTEPRSFARASKRWRIGILLAGPAMNLMLAVLLFATSFIAGSPTVVSTSVVISQVGSDTPAAAAGMQAGDVVLEANGQTIHDGAQLRDITQKSAGQPMMVRVRRDGIDLNLTVNVRATWPEGQGPMGVILSNQPTTAIKHYPLPQALLLGAEETASVVILTFTLPVMLVRQQIPIEMARPVSPVGIYQITNQVTTETVQSGWWWPILKWAGMLSAALGITNLLPIPGLDGGRLIFIILEMIRGRRVAAEREAAVHIAGMVVLLALVVVVAYTEIINPIQIPGMTP
jgi:regulator of sigma E protease